MRYVTTALAALAMAAATAGMAAPAGSAGHFYRVPVDVHKNAHGSWMQPADEITSDTAELLVYKRDDGTTAVQLKVPSEPVVMNQPAISKISAYTIHRDSVPQQARYVFGSVDTIHIPFNPMNRHMSGGIDYIVDLTGLDGLPVADSYQFSDAAGEPLTNVKVEYSFRSGSAGTVKSGTVSLDDEGKFIVPKPTFNFQGGVSTPAIDFTLIEPESGTRLILSPFMWHSFGRPEGTSVTVPFLNDWAAPPDNVDVYIGQLFNDDDTAASGTKFRAYGSAYQRSHFGPAAQEFIAGPEGRFRLAYQQVDQSKSSAWRPEPGISLNFEGSKQSHQLKPGREIEVRKLREATVALEFLGEDGKPLDFSTTPPLYQLRPHQPTGFVYSKTDSSARHPGASRQIKTSYGEIEPMQLIVPATYFAVARGYAFHEEQLDIGETSITFRPMLADFELYGRVTDLEGKPVAGAFVLAEDGAGFFQAAMSPQNELIELLNETLAAAGGHINEPGLYIAKSGADGNFKISGNSLSALARLIVVSGDYATILTAPLPGQLEKMRQGPRRNPFSSMGARMEGKHDYSTVKLAREATATLTLNEDKSGATTGTRMTAMVVIKAEFLKTGEEPKDAPPYMMVNQHQWSSRQVTDGDRISFSVPAETTATIEIRSGRSGELMQYEVDILDPLKLGEVRDLGVIEQKDGKPFKMDWTGTTN